MSQVGGAPRLRGISMPRGVDGYPPKLAAKLQDANFSPLFFLEGEIYIHLIFFLRTKVHIMTRPGAEIKTSSTRASCVVRPEPMIQKSGEKTR